MCFKNLTGTRLRVMVWVGFVVGCVAKFITGSLFVYNVYQDDIKQAFNYTQRESEWNSKGTAAWTDYDWLIFHKTLKTAVICSLAVL